MNKISGTYEHTNSIAEQTVFTFAPTDDTLIWGVWLDFINVTQDTDIRVKYAIDGGVLRTFQTSNWMSGDNDGILLEGVYGVDDDFRVTLQSLVLEGASRYIPYSLYYHTISSYNLTDSTGTFSFQNNTNEQTLLTLSPGTGDYNLNWGLWLDLANLTQNLFIRLYHRIDGLNYRLYDTSVWGTGDDDGVLLQGGFASDRPVRITLQSDVAEGAIRNIPYKLFYYPQLPGAHVGIVDRSASSIKMNVVNGTLDPIDFQLLVSGLPIDLTNVDHIEFWTLDKKEGQRQYTSSGITPNISIIDAENGLIRVTPTSTSFRDFLGPYKGYFWVFDSSTQKYSVPEAGFVNILVREGNS